MEHQEQPQPQAAAPAAEQPSLPPREDGGHHGHDGHRGHGIHRGTGGHDHDHDRRDYHGHRHDNQWENNILNCSPCETCLLGFCLPCMLIGRTSSRMRDPAMSSFSELNGDCVAFGLIHYLTGCGWVYNMIKRTEIRERYNIRGNVCGDCCASFWCLCCSMIQQDKEVRRRTGAAASGPVTDGYGANKERMHMPAPAYNQDAAAAANPSQPQPQQPMMQPEAEHAAASQGITASKETPAN